MDPRLTRIAALLLIPNLIGDPALCASFTNPSVPITQTPVAVFQQEALTLALRETLSSILQTIGWRQRQTEGAIARSGLNLHQINSVVFGPNDIVPVLRYISSAIGVIWLWKRTVWFLSLRPFILHSNTSDLHNHTSGSLWPQDLAEMFAQNEAAVRAFKSVEEYAHIDPTNPKELKDILRWNEAHIEGLNGAFEKAFQIGKFILQNDPDFRFHKEWYYRMTKNAARQGNHVIGVRSTFDAQKSTEDFNKAVQAAVEGIEQAEREVKFNDGIDCTGVIFLAIRKSTPSAQASRLVDQWLALRDQSPRLAAKLVGIDSISSELGAPVQSHDDAFLKAKSKGLELAFHAGEEWKPGELKDALNRIEYVIDHYSPQYLTNALALFVDPDSLEGPVYQTQRGDIRAQQNRLFAKIKERGIVLEISPVSNKRITMKMKQAERWSMRPLGPLLAMGLQIVSTADNPGIIQTSFIEELRRLYYGKSIYGPMNVRGIRQLVKNSKQVYSRFQTPDREDSGSRPTIGEIQSYIHRINPIVQRTLAKKYPNSYPALCPFFSDLTLILLYEQFPEGLLIHYFTGTRGGVPHKWLEVTASSRRFFLSLSEGQFQIDDALLQLRKKNGYRRFIKYYHAKNLDGAEFVEMSEDRQNFYQQRGLSDIQEEEFQFTIDLLPLLKTIHAQLSRARWMDKIRFWRGPDDPSSSAGGATVNVPVSGSSTAQTAPQRLSQTVLSAA